jgi:hypothetical protein
MPVSTIDIALRFAEAGYGVFPLYLNRQGVMVKPYGWAQNVVTDPIKSTKAIPATTDVQVVADWPEIVRQKYRSTVAGFGVLGTGCVIIDIDVKDGRPGLDEFTAVSERYKIPSTPMVTKTKSGGYHLYYKRPERYIETILKTVAGVRIGDTQCTAIDLRGDGGFVMGPTDIVGSPDEWVPGSYVIKRILPPAELPEFPANLVKPWIKGVYENDLDNIVSMTPLVPSDPEFMVDIKRYKVPGFIPKGWRNMAFFLFIQTGRNKGIDKEVVRRDCHEMAKVVEEPETLSESVSINEMIETAFQKIPEGPYEVAMDVIKRGLFQITSYKAALHYVILDDNPYVQSKMLHDETTMKTLMLSFQRDILDDKGKPKSLNPMSIIPKRITDENRADMIGFKPGAGIVFSLHDEPGSKQFLNTYRPIGVPRDFTADEPEVWEEFELLVNRLFGESGYQLGMDFIAWIVQRPEFKPSIAPFIISAHRGVGKSLLFNVLTQILGTSKCGIHQGRFVKLDEISGRFFDPSGCLINMIDEVQFAIHHNMRQESTMFWRHLKNLITAETISVEIKGGLTYQCPNSAAVMLAGNSGQFFPVEEFDRRLWIIDANPPRLELGTVDRLFDLVRRAALPPDDRKRYIFTIRQGLMRHQIQHDLASMVAPMTDVKQELYEDGLTDLEAWFVRHFNDTGNLFAATSVVTQSAVQYVLDQYRMIDDRGFESIFRELRRKWKLRPIRLRADGGPGKLVMVPEVLLDGSLVKAEKRDVMYTTRDHGTFDAMSADAIKEQFMINVASISRYKQRQLNVRLTKIAPEALLGVR